MDSGRQSLRGRPWSWITGRPRLTDGVIVGFSFLAGTLSLLGSLYRHSVVAALLGLAVVEAAALFWRRTQPIAVLLVIALATGAAMLLATDRDASTAALVFAVYALSVYGPNRARLVVVVTAIALVVVAVGLLFLNDFDAARRLMPAGATSLVAWVVGDYVRSRGRFFADLVARHQHEREQAAEEERLRIARELHDVVAHNVSAMAIQAGAARVSGASSEDALRSIEDGARATLSELNRLLGVLRKSPGAPLEPQPTLADAEKLLAPARAAGLQATIKVTGEQRPLPQAVDLSAFRIVQEALTNVLKHANASRVEVVIDHQPEALALTITDNGTGTTTSETRGHGLIGVRERVELFGGQLSTGSSPLGGFTIRVKLPIKP